MAKKQLWNDGWSFTELPVKEESYKFLCHLSDSFYLYSI